MLAIPEYILSEESLTTSVGEEEEGVVSDPGTEIMNENDAKVKVCVYLHIYLYTCRCEAQFEIRDGYLRRTSIKFNCDRCIVRTCSCFFRLSRSTALQVMASTLDRKQLLDYTLAGIRRYLKSAMVSASYIRTS